jgi:transketolase
MNLEIRKTILEIVHNGGASHIGSALSLVEILDTVFKNCNIEKIKKSDIGRDRVILSKGHGTSALYSTMFHHGLISNEELKTYFKNGSVLGGHASHHVPFVEHSTGALGHGLPVGVGMAIGLRTKKFDSKVFVILGDGELHEGSNWEAIMFAGHEKLKNLVVLVDCNELSQVGKLEECCSIEPLESKFRSNNFEVFDVDGHDESKIDQAIKKSTETGLPRAILCRTTKGKGISFMECNNLWHYKSPQGEDYEKALLELN